MAKPRTRSGSVGTVQVPLDEFQRLIMESEKRLMKRLDEVSLQLNTIENALKKADDRTVSSAPELKTIKDLMLQHQHELKTIKVHA